MAVGRTHDVINVSLLPLFLLGVPRDLMLPFSAGYLVGTFLLSPDLDLSRSDPSRRWKILRVLWLPYQKLSKHRGISHLPLLGTLIRLVYLAGILVFIYFVVLGLLSLVKEDLSLKLAEFDILSFLRDLVESEHFLYFVAGAVVADVVHIAVDKVSTFVKKRL